VIAVANGLFIFGVVLGNVLYETVVQREIPAERLSRVSSFDWAISIVVMPLGLASVPIASAGSGMAVPSVRALRAAPVAGPG